MYVTSMVLEGFKSYGQRTEINGFDREFNAITGLNGSGKSNILDAICFVLGISNLGQVRAGTLQDLVYKSGQAGIIKASVTITFNNRDKKQSPLGYEQHADITVTRQVIMGGKNKYMINGSNVQNKKVQDLFCSIQLNVNNPNFLIMQGRITKVLNMKPPEILSMIEEAAGTRMYESKKQAAQKTIQKKDDKLKEINSVVEDDINPKLQKLKDERSQYLEYTRVQQELKRLTKIFVAWKYVSAKETTEKAAEQLQKNQCLIDTTLEKMKEGKNQIKEIDGNMVVLNKKRDAESGGKLEDLEERLVQSVNVETKASVAEKSVKDTINSEKKKKKQLEKCLCEDAAALAAKELELKRVEGMFQSLKDNDAADSVALAAAQSKFQAVSSGLLANDDGTNATLQDQLMGAKREMAEAETEAKQAEMQLTYSRGSLKDKLGDMKQTATEYQNDQRALQNMEKELASHEGELGTLNYEDGQVEQLQAQKQAFVVDIFALKEKINPFEAKHPQLNFRYKDPEPNFRRTSVKGLVCKLFKVKNPLYSTALEVTAGGRLFNVIVDSEITSKKLLQKGELQYRTTIIPLNKIHGYSIDQNTVGFAQKVGGKENVHPALSLIEYSQEFHPAMQWVFGQTLICKDLNTAKNVTFHERILKRTVTLEGDVVDPGGTLSGGASKKGGSLLNQIEDLRVAQEEKTSKEDAIAAIDIRIRNLTKVAERYGSLKQRVVLRQHEVELVRKKLQLTTHHQLQEEVNVLKKTIAELEGKIQTSKQLVKDGDVKVKNLEYKLKNAKTIKERELKSAEMEMNRLEKKAEGSRTQWKQREQEFEALKLEIAELKAGIETTRAQIAAAEEALTAIMQQAKEAAVKTRECKDDVEQIRAEVKAQKDAISEKNVEIQKMMHMKEKLIKSNREAELEMKKLEHENTSIMSEVSECESRVNDLLKNYDWLKSDNQYLGDNTSEMYNLEEGDPTKVGKRIAKLEEVKEKLGRNINTRAINLLDKEEEQFNDLMRKKRIVDNDKAKIVSVIESLDVKKKELLRHACEQVNKDFGSIFSTLLPGSCAKLQPPDGMDVLDGLEVKVGFGDTWKDSLGELSGGQRSLVALSLILAMLLFNPAPIYILDEVDAALDLSHTQNIGNMLKSHFRHSQFIIVSLKDGMFNNANVLFRTRFVDGMSTVGRTVQHLNSNSMEPQSSKNKKSRNKH